MYQLLDNPGRNMKNLAVNLAGFFYVYRLCVSNDRALCVLELCPLLMSV